MQKFRITLQDFMCETQEHVFVTWRGVFIPNHTNAEVVRGIFW